MADLIFAFDPAVDRPIPVPEDAPPAVAETIAAAVRDALGEAVAVARRSRAAALVICGRLLDASRASPAQAAAVRRMITSLAADGCRTVLMADDPAECTLLARMLGEPAGLHFVTPAAAVEFEVRGLIVEIASAHGPVDAADVGAAPLRRRFVVGWDTALWDAERWDDPPTTADHVHPALAAETPRRTASHPTPASFAAVAAAAPTWSHPATFCIWASRRPQRLPAGVHHLPPLQARSGHEPAAGSCHGITLFDRDPAAAAAGIAAPHADWRGSWREFPTHGVAWRTLSLESAGGGDEELATAIWSALEARPPAAHAALEVVRCSIACGTSVARRVRVAEIAAETLARVRQLYDAKTFRVWCRELVADAGESLAPLGHARSGSRPGTTTSFSSALADIVTLIEQSPAPVIPPDMAREAGWLALELVEST